MIESIATPVQATPAQRPVSRAAAQAGETREDGLTRLKKLKKSCSDLESIFIGTLLKAMRETVVDGGLLPKSAGRDVYESMFDQQLSVHLAQGGSLGMGQMVFNQLLRPGDQELLDSQELKTVSPQYRRIVPKDLIDTPDFKKVARPRSDGAEG
ncbi:MAG: rod-binding protein [Proteobacteria bacterium]|nr:rod-binding protein [Pseudomonadota bacterium]